MLMVSAAALATATAGIYFWDYSRAGEELSKFAWNVGSNPLKCKQKGGHTWTSSYTLRTKFAPEVQQNTDQEPDFLESLISFKTKENNKPLYEKRHIFIDEFRFFPRTVKKCKPFFIGKKHMEKTRIFLTPIDVRQGVLVLGPVNSGKTEFFYNIVLQPWYKRGIFRCAKGADFTPVLVDKTRGFPLNLYNKSAAVWDIMRESNFLLMMKSVAMDLVVGAVGESKDQFFANSAAERVTAMFETAYLIGHNSTARWAALEEEAQNFEKRVSSLKSTENKDVFNNFLLIKETLLFWAWRIQNAEKTFTISDFQKSNWRLVMNGSEPTLRSYYSAFFSAVVQEALRGPDQKGNETVLLLDEYLTFSMSENTREAAHTMLRSKDYSIWVGAQFLPADDTKKLQVINASRFVTVLFNLVDPKTKELFQNPNEIKYKEEEISTAKNKNGDITSSTSSSQERQASFLTEEELALKPKYHHLTILHSGEAYLGYTPQAKTQKIYDPLTDIIDLVPFKAKLRGVNIVENQPNSLIN